MNPFVLLKGDTLGKTIYNTAAAAAFLGVVIWVGYGVVTGRYWKWQADRQERRADVAEAQAEVAQGNANSANAGAANASQTRATMDAGTFNIRVLTEQAAERAESYESIDDDAHGALPSDLVRELDAAEDRAGAAAARLRGKSGRRTAPPSS